MNSNLPLLPLRSGALFPGTTLSLAVGRARSVALVRSLSVGDVILAFAQKNPRKETPSTEDLHDVGTFAAVRQIVRRGPEEYQLTVEGLGRAKIVRLDETGKAFLTAEVASLDDVDPHSDEAQELGRALKEQVREIVADAGGALAQIDAADADPGKVADQIAAHLGIGLEGELEVLREANVPARVKLVARLLGEVKTKAEVRSRIDNEVRKEVGKTQREHVLREQMRAIKRELGEGDDDDLKALREKLDEANLPEEARKIADRGLERLERMGNNSAESHVIRNHLELIADLPWSAQAEGNVDLEAIAKKLDADHYGLEDVKKRILEHMAVLRLAGHKRGTILCLVGPPGVGKTSLGQSIADATGRPLVRVSLGGVRDEAEIRGHRRTYVGALPGRIINALKKAKVKNPLLLLDEVDKLSSTWGSPEAALLEVLDPEQNKAFVDHYLEVPFDLSEVFFICTANTLETLSPPLRDRLEIVEISGYTPEEKTHILYSHLLPKQRKLHGLTDAQIDITKKAALELIVDYTREAGVRQLEREVSRLCRSAALEVAKRKPDSVSEAIVMDEAAVHKHLGKPKFTNETAERTAFAGVATGLAWTPFGGDILFIETSKMRGKGNVEITGQLGDVMKESARAALTYVRSNAEKLGIVPQALENQDIHIHVPAGAVPKDGPSAGVTIFTALASLFTGRRVRKDTAMTGECTLRGRVLPVGGIKAKVLAAHRAGITRIILPRKCERDLDTLPEGVRKDIEFFLVDDMSEVLDAALESRDAEGATGDVRSGDPRGSLLPQGTSDEAQAAGSNRTSPPEISRTV
jgi:ATP-dependent Lon protease